MLPLIGIVVSAYVFTRMFELLMDVDAHIAVRISAGITLVVALLVAFALFTSGMSSGPSIAGRLDGAAAETNSDNRRAQEGSMGIYVAADNS